MKRGTTSLYTWYFVSFFFSIAFFEWGKYHIDANQLLSPKRNRDNSVKNSIASRPGRSSHRAELWPNRGSLVEVRRISRRRRPNRRRRNWLQLIRMPRVWLTENCRILCSSLVRMYKVMFLRRNWPPIRTWGIGLMVSWGGRVSIEVVATKFMVVAAVAVVIVVVGVAALLLSSVVNDWVVNGIWVVIGADVDWVFGRVRRFGRVVVMYSSASLSGSPGLKKFAVSLFFAGRWWTGRALKFFES